MVVDWFRDGHVVLLGVHDDGRLFPLNGQRDRQGEGNGQDSLSRLRVLEDHGTSGQGFQDDLLLRLLSRDMAHFQQESRGEDHDIGQG